jgi:hypothetical protein
MRYIRVRWIHSNPDSPVDLYSELDDQRWEVRKVEIFPDGRAGLAGPNGSTVATRLGEKPVPPVEEIGRDPEFQPEEISPAEFEAVWDSAQKACRVDAARAR